MTSLIEFLYSTGNNNDYFGTEHILATKFNLRKIEKNTFSDFTGKHRMTKSQVQLLTLENDHLPDCSNQKNHQILWVERVLPAKITLGAVQNKAFFDIGSGKHRMPKTVKDQVLNYESYDLPD